MDDNRWLNEEEQQTWRAFVLATRLLFGRFERDLQRNAGLPLTYYEILSMLSEAPNRSTRMSELAELLQISPSRLSHAAARLEEQGAIRRELCPSDRRGWNMVLTDDGYRTVQAAAPHHVESVRRHLIDQLTPVQLEHLREISETLLDHLAPSMQLSSESPALPSSDSDCEPPSHGAA